MRIGCFGRRPGRMHLPPGSRAVLSHSRACSLAMPSMPGSKGALLDLDHRLRRNRPSPNPLTFRVCIRSSARDSVR
eukprot:6729009-Pyramimonas_sp.AAC.1